MKAQFIIFALSGTGSVILFILLLLVAGIIGYLTAWFYAKSVYTPVIKTLEEEKAELNSRVADLKKEIVSLNDEIRRLKGMVSDLEKEIAEKDKIIKDLSKRPGKKQ